MLGEEFSPFRPAAFFEVAADCFKLPEESRFSALAHAKYGLPDTSFLLLEEAFATLHMGWHPEGLYFHAFVGTPFSDVFYPDIERGDSLELFIDTREIKSASYNTKFCHHFFFLPKEYNGVQVKEITRFRQEEQHDLCDPSDLQLETHFGKDSYSMKIFIPSHCLYGYDPTECDRIGFAYRVNRRGGPSQHFCVSSDEFAFAHAPYLWGRINLVDANSPTHKGKSPRG